MLSMSAPSEEALKAEIARLSGAINAHKSGKPTSLSYKSNTYVNPNYNPPLRPAFPSKTFTAHKPADVPSPSGPPSQPRELVIDGVAFQSSKRSLVRKDIVKPPLAAKPPSRPIQPHHVYVRKCPGTRATQRPYKSKVSRRRPQNNNMTLDNGRKPVRVGRKTKSMKYVDKQCPRFSTTGVCTKGLTCCYKHDPTKIAICWPFLNGTCPNAAESCSLSHEPTPERTPLCVHFANNGRCKNGNDCLFPHVRVGPRTGVCRDFAVLGYCEKGLDCEHQHVRECPDFAEKGTCPNPHCKLPHVIRANQRRTETAKQSTASTTAAEASEEKSPENSGPIYGNDANIGDEYISLIFHESEESAEDEDASGASDSEEDADGEVVEESEEDTKPKTKK